MIRGWCCCLPAYRFLTADDAQWAAAPADDFARGGIGLLGVSFLWGLAAMGLWHGGRLLFGQPTGMYLLSNVVVVFCMLLWPYRRAAGALAGILAGEDATLRGLLAAMLVFLPTAGLMVLRPGWHFQEPFLPMWIAWVRPESKIDRVLLLMPLWGAWSMLILLQFRRPSDDEPILRAVARGCGPLTAAAMMGALLAASLGAFAYLPWTQLTISATAVAAALGGGPALVRRHGRVDRSVLLAINLLTQLAFLLAVVANTNTRLW